MRKHEIAILAFATRAEMPFANDRAERDSRPGKFKKNVRQKTAGCFRTERYTRACCRTSNYLQMMADQGVNSLAAIQDTPSEKLHAER